MVDLDPASVQRLLQKAETTDPTELHQTAAALSKVAAKAEGVLAAALQGPCAAAFPTAPTASSATGQPTEAHVSARAPHRATIASCSSAQQLCSPCPPDDVLMMLSEHAVHFVGWLFAVSAACPAAAPLAQTA